MIMANIPPWSRCDVSTCNCPEKSYRHVHCRCQLCQGRATTRGTELRHWKEACLCFESDVGINASENNRNEEINLLGLGEDINSQDQNAIEESEDVSDADIIIDEVSYSESSYSSTENCENADFEVDNDNLNEVNPLKQLVVKSVLDALGIMENSGSSIKTFEEILDYGKNMLFTSLDENVDVDVLNALWPKSWSDAKALLKEEGLSEPKLYFICYCREEKELKRNGKTTKTYHYTRKWSVMEYKDELCPHCGNPGYIKYFYLGLHEKLKNWFLNKSMCKKMLSHWREREHWLNRDSSWPSKKEIWDGKRWLDLQWFWDPNKTWVLPTRCIHCYVVISSDVIVNSPKDADGKMEIRCPECLNTFTHEATETRGSPLNIALIGHWDAWQPFSTSGRSSGSFELSIANMSKKDRAHVSEVYVVGFVPCSSIPNDLPEGYDPFLLPLMNDLCDGFIDGFEIQYPKDIKVDNYEANEHEIVRVLMLCWAGDHPAQCEIGKVLNQGKCPCRRCKLEGQQGETSYHYYYGNNRYHTRYPCEERDIRCEEQTFYDLDNETRKSVRKKNSSEKGFTGTSILHKYLYPLYGFDILHHMIYDVFHTVPLNLCKNQISRLINLELVDITYLDEQLLNFPWTTELKNGRIPLPIGKDAKGLRFWKAETFQKFAYPLLESILDNHVNSPDLEILSLVSYFTELHFHSGRDGWTDDMIETHRKMAERLNVKIEETQGLEMCSISVHNMKHIHEDIMNFSSADNYWCAVFERAVKDYVRRSHNCKGLEATFAKAEARREYLKSLEEESDVDQGDINVLQQLTAGSIKDAREICKTANRNSVLIASTRTVHVVELSNIDILKIANSLSKSQSEISRIATSSKKCFMQSFESDGIVFSVNEHCIIRASEIESDEHVMCIDKFLLVKCQGMEEIVVEGTLRNSKQDDNGKNDVLFWNGFPLVTVHDHHDEEKVFVVVKHIARKVMLYQKDNTNTVIVIDYMRKIRKSPREIFVPVYPEKGDMLLIRGENENDIWHGKVLSVNWQNKTVDVFFYVESNQRPSCYTRETYTRFAKNTVSLDAVIGLATGHWNNANSWQRM